MSSSGRLYSVTKLTRFSFCFFCVCLQNSIRHNLSLHTRFIRVQNEGTGKSSWWMLNPDGTKCGKAPRRRAVSMDNSTKYLKSKGRVSRKQKLLGRPGQGPGSGLGSVNRVSLRGSPEQGGSPTGPPPAVSGVAGRYRASPPSRHRSGL